MQRYFASITNNNVKLSLEDEHHILHVMRMRAGEKIEVVDSSNLYICEIVNVSPLEIKVLKQKEEDVEINKQITLFFALAKGDKIDLVMQKATELGVHRIVLFKSKRCVVSFDNKDFSKKIVRYNKIVKEAAEQCHRLVVPSIEGVIELKDIGNYLSDVNLVAYEKEAGNTADSFNLNKDIESVSIMIGSEGGFDEEEISFLKEKGFKVISLGKRILRCETAAIYALSVLAYQLEK